MAEGYSLVHVIGGSAGYQSATVTLLGSVDYSGGGLMTPYSGLGSGATAGQVIYCLTATCAEITLQEFWVTIGVAPTVTAPILKFWRRPNSTTASVAAGGTGDVAINIGTATGTTMTIPLTSPTVASGNTYVSQFTGGNTLAVGESMLVEIDTVSSSASSAMLGVTGSCATPAVYQPGVSTTVIANTAGAAKSTPSPSGRMYRCIS